ncbi:unnamed protein product [Agarophyton chilense]
MTILSIQGVKLQNLYAANQKILLFIRIFGYAAGGAAAGILGLQGFEGFLFYILVSLMITITLLFKTFFDPGRYLRAPISTVLFFGAFGRNSILTYILFWTMLFSFR